MGLVHPFSPDWYVGGGVDAPDRLGSIVEVKRLQGAVFQSKEAAETHGLKMCKEWIDGRYESPPQ
jgi:hypothetical protein